MTATPALTPGARKGEGVTFRQGTNSPSTIQTPMTPSIPLCKAVENLAITLGAKTLSDGINWSWANGFPSKAAAECFIQNLPPGYETRGTYRDNPYMTEHSVRYR